jgi:hypothetical protein
MSDNDKSYGLVAQALATAIESTERRLAILPQHNPEHDKEKKWRRQAMERLIEIGKVAAVRWAIDGSKELS